MHIRTCASNSEGFPNVVGEAMACGVDSVSTNAGDCAIIVDGAGLLVPPRKPEAMAAAWQDILNRDRDHRAELGRSARARILKQFGTVALVDNTLRALRTIEPGSSRARADRHQRLSKHSTVVIMIFGAL